MKNMDVMAVDGRLLSAFKAVLDEGSVTAAANRLNLSQSSVSHSLERLRGVFGDPLFVRSGRSVAPTERALALAPEIAAILERIEGLLDEGDVDPGTMKARFCLSANDFERELLAPQLAAVLLRDAPGTQLRIIDTRGDVTDSLRTRECDVVVTPLLPANTSDLHAQHLFDDSYVCFFDPEHLTPGQVRKNYLSMKHVVVRFSRTEPRIIDEVLRANGVSRHVVIEVPSFAALPQLMKGTALVATLPSRGANALFSGFGTCPFPFASPTLAFQMVWHRTTHVSARYRWFRSLIRDALKTSGQAARARARSR